LHQRLAERHDRELERKASGLEDAALDRFGQPAQVDVAVDELAPAVADPDHRAARESLVGEALALQPRAMEEAVEILTGEPLAAAIPVAAGTLLHLGSGSLVGLGFEETEALAKCEQRGPLAPRHRGVAG